MTKPMPKGRLVLEIEHEPFTRRQKTALRAVAMKIDRGNRQAQRDAYKLGQLSILEAVTSHLPEFRKLVRQEIEDALCATTDNSDGIAAKAEKAVVSALRTATDQQALAIQDTAAHAVNAIFGGD